MEDLTKMNNLCRLCLSEDLEDSYHIFDEGLSNKIIILTQIDVQVNDLLPKLICRECRYQLERSHYMRITAKQCDNKLRKHIRLVNQNKPSKLLEKDYKDDDTEEFEETILESTKYFVKVEEEIAKMKADFEAEKERILSDVKNALGAKFKSPRKSTRQIPENPVVLNKFAPSSNNQTTETVEEITKDEDKVMDEIVLQEFEILSTDRNGEIEIEFVTIDEEPSLSKKSQPNYLTSESNYFKAIDDVENAELDANGEKKIFQCAFEDCEEKFVRRQACRTHYYNHITKQSIPTGFTCKYCQKTFKIASALQRHERVHSGDRPFKCDFKGCTKAFSQKELLKRHSSIHLSMKDAPFNCNFCDRRFRQKAPLNVHIAKEHSEDSPADSHVCSICQKTFQHSSGLSRHFLIHSGKIFSCEKCGKSFNDKSALKRHGNIHKN